MRNLFFALGAVSLVVPAAVTFAPTEAQAKSYDYGAPGYDQRRDRRYREWRGRDGRRYCRKPDGTTGLVVGAVGGALAGRMIDTRGDRTAGTVIGGVAGALAGREIERSGSKNRCR
jgi:uncharacterized protein YcfJ